MPRAQARCRTNFYPFTKRAFDVLVAVVLMVLLSPLLVTVAAAVRMRFGKPVIFRQQRLGLHGKPFEINKFRTLLDVRDSDGYLLSDAERMTPLGKFLRRSSLDELPTLINVVRGDMSLVGPRPFLAEYLDRYTDEEMDRHNVRPGITGWAQVQGRNSLAWNERLKSDLWYVRHVSFMLDMAIIRRTVGVVLKGQGTSAPNHVSMHEFRPED